MAVSAELRGGIVSRSGENLTTAVEPGMRLPVLPSLIHTVGYVHPRYGTAGLERTFDGALSRGITGGGVAAGATRVHTSIDLALQEVVEQALGDLTGAVVVLDPWSGAVLAMASSPRPAAGLVTSDALADERSPLLNRATQGLYPPGSAFKPVVLAAALEGGLVTSETRWDDGGSIVIDGYVVQNAGGRALGRLSPAEALALSSNVVFVRLAVALGPEPLRLQSHALGIGDQPGFEIPYRAGRLGSLQSSVQLAAAGIGQGDVLVTPLEMALVTSVIANGGYRVYPHLVTHFEAAGRLAAGVRTAPIRAVSPETAEILQEGLRKAVAEGTFAGRIDPSLLAGKTGTAENPHGEPHAWFIGFAPARQPRRGVCGLGRERWVGCVRGWTDCPAHRRVRRQRRSGCEQAVRMCLKSGDRCCGRIDPERPIRDLRTTRRRRYGHRLSRARPYPRPTRRDQGAPAPIRRGHRLRRTLPA